MRKKHIKKGILQLEGKKRKQNDRFLGAIAVPIPAQVETKFIGGIVNKIFCGWRQKRKLKFIKQKQKRNAH